MEPRPVEQWMEIIRQLNVHAPLAPNGAQVIARRILGDIVGYQHPSGNEATRRRREATLREDTAQLANALLAFAGHVSPTTFADGLARERAHMIAEALENHGAVIGEDGRAVIVGALGGKP